MFTKRDLLRSAALAAITASTAKSVPVLAQTSADRPGFLKAKDIAEAGFIYGLPSVMGYGVMYEFAVDRNSGQFKAPFNQIANAANVFTYKDTAIVTPNSDTPYSVYGWTCGWSRSCFRSRRWTRSATTRSCCATAIPTTTAKSGPVPREAKLATTWLPLRTGRAQLRPELKRCSGRAPSSQKVFRSSTQFSLAIYRTQLFSPDDLDNVKKVQAGYKVQTLSAYLKQPATTAAATIDFPKIDKELAKTNFFDYLDFALQFAPAQENEKEIRAQLASIGVGPGRTFNFKDLPLEQKLEVGLGMKEGEKKVDEAVANAGKAINGWRVSSLFGDSAFFNGDWLKRAAGAKGGIYGNDAAEAMYPARRTDSDGQTLDGSQHNYTLTFPAGQLPPVNAFWSLTMYDGKSQLLIENPINRYLINSPMLPTMKTNSEGSLTLYIQNKSPGADKESNWLPAPNGPIYLVLRLYWPKVEPPSILPVGEGTWQPPDVKRVA